MATCTSPGAKARIMAGPETSCTPPRSRGSSRSLDSSEHGPRDRFVRQRDDTTSPPGSETGNYLFGRRLRAARRPGETLFAGLEEARKDALEMAQEADAPPKARTEDAAAVRVDFGKGTKRRRVIRRHMGGERYTPGVAFILAGLGILFVTGAFEAEIVLTGGLGTPSYLGATDLIRLSAVPWGLGLLFFGYALDHPEVLWDRVRGRRILATFLLFADGAIHIVAVGEHVESVVVAFFLVLAPLEFIGGFTILRASRPIVWAWLLGALGLIGLYVASRLIVLPFVSQQYVFGPLGLISKAIEGVLAFALAQELWTTSTARRPSAARPATQR